MVPYVDPIPAIRKLLVGMMTEKVYGNTFPANVALPAVLIRSVGGLGYTRLQLLVRANDDITSMQTLIRAMNIILKDAALINLEGVWAEMETNPISSTDEDTGKPESWCFIRLEHIEAEGL